MSNGRFRMHGGMSTGAPKSNKNAIKHGRYTAEAIERRQKISGLIHAMKALAKPSE
jgi:ssDNA-binding replication factor A large subunit